MVFSIIVPTLNPSIDWDDWIKAIKMQTLQPLHVLVIDSSSTDDTVNKSLSNGFRVHVIPKSQFNHGGTRQLGIELCTDSEILIFLTQDAVLADQDALANIISVFDSADIGAAYGRQLPRPGSKVFEAHARLFNYPARSRTTSLRDVPNLGVKVAFISNSFAAYRRGALLSVGGFPSNVIVSEDMYTSGKMLLAGWKIAYCADARVYHSHRYSPLQEFRRYFDIGVFYAHQGWLLDKLGKPEGEGLRFIRSELLYLIKSTFWRIPESFLRAILKYSGYKLGLIEHCIPVWIKKRISMQKNYWK